MENHKENTRREIAINVLYALNKAGYTLGDLIATLEEVSDKNHQESPEKKLHVRITQIFRRLGVPTNILGYGYLRRGVELCYTDKTYLQAMTKELYPAIAIEYNTIPSRVEHAMRHAIERTCDNISTDVYEEFFGYSVSRIKSKPTNNQFIATIVDYLEMEDEEAK